MFDFFPQTGWIFHLCLSIFNVYSGQTVTHAYIQGQVQVSVHQLSVLSVAFCLRIWCHRKYYVKRLGSLRRAQCKKFCQMHREVTALYHCDFFTKNRNVCFLIASQLGCPIRVFYLVLSVPPSPPLLYFKWLRHFSHGKENPQADRLVLQSVEGSFLLLSFYFGVIQPIPQGSTRHHCFTEQKNVSYDIISSSLYCATGTQSKLLCLSWTKIAWRFLCCHKSFKNPQAQFNVLSVTCGDSNVILPWGLYWIHIKLLLL